jgi:hypothetical protein
MLLHIRNFVDKVSMLETKQSNSVVLNMTDARGLRDDIVKLLADLYEQKKEETIQTVQIIGGKF